MKQRIILLALALPVLIGATRAVEKPSDKIDKYCALVIAAASGLPRDSKIVPMESLDVRNLTQNGGWDGYTLPDGTYAVRCLRLSIVPLPNDYRVLKRLPMFYIGDTAGRVASLEFDDNGKPGFRVLQGTLPSAMKAQIDKQIADYQAFF